MRVSVRRVLLAVGLFVGGWLSHVLFVRVNTSEPSPMAVTSTGANTHSSPTPRDDGIVRQASDPLATVTTNVLSSEVVPNSSKLGNSNKHNHDPGQGEKEPAISLDDVWLSNDAVAWNKASLALLKQIKELIQQDKIAKARELLDNLLRLDAKNIGALKLSALIYRKQGQTLLALNEIYQAKFAAEGNGQEQSLYEETHQWLSELAARLISDKDEIGLLDLYKKAVELEPDYGRHYLNLAQRYLDLGNTKDAINTLETARFDSSISIEIDNMLAAIRQQKPVDFSSAYKIPLTRKGHQYYAQVRINGEYDTTWLLDTGASVSAITPETLSSLPVNVSEEGQAWFNTAAGMVNAKTVVINGLEIANIHIDRMKVGVLDLASGGHFDGLLGMDFLRQFNFYLDQSNNVLYLRNP